MDSEWYLRKRAFACQKAKIYRDKKIGKVYFVDFDNVVDCFSSVENKQERLDTKLLIVVGW